jgi:hypothetical protein
MMPQGTFGWVMDEGYVNVRSYKHVVFVNSSVRGPFLPAYWPGDIHWTRVLTDRITDQVKLVGWVALPV